MTDPSSTFLQSFPELSDPESEPNAGEIPAPGNPSPLLPLKTIVLSLDWEISDDTISSFLSEIQRLNSVIPEDAVVKKFLQLLDSLGKYILRRKNAVHPDSIRLLHSAYESLERIALHPDMDEHTRRSLLFDQLSEYRKLKDKVATRPDDTDSKPSTPGLVAERISESAFLSKTPLSLSDRPDSRPNSSISENPDSAYMTPLPPHVAFSLAVDEIKQLIQAEFRAIRAEIHLWRMEK